MSFFNNKMDKFRTNVDTHDAGRSADIIKNGYLDSKEPGNEDKGRSLFNSHYEGKRMSFAEMASEELKLNNEKLAFLEKSGRTETSDGETKEELLAANKKLNFVLNYGNNSSSSAQNQAGVVKQESATELQDRANRALANNAGEEEWSEILKEVKDRRDQLELQGPPSKNKWLGNFATQSYNKEMNMLDKLEKLATERAGTTSSQPNPATNNTEQAEIPASSSQSTPATNNTEQASISESNEEASTKSASQFSQTANALVTSLNEAHRLYRQEGPAPRTLDIAFEDIDKLDGQLQEAINNLGDNPTSKELAEIKGLATALHEYSDRLGHKLEQGSAAQVALGKSEDIVETLIDKLDVAIDKAENREQMERINNSANEFSASINRITDDIDRDKLSSMGQAIYDELETLDDNLRTAINGLGENPSAEDLQETRELARTLRDKVDNLGNDTNLNDSDKALLQETEGKGNQLVKDLKAEDTTTEGDNNTSETDLASQQAFTQALESLAFAQIQDDMLNSKKDFDFMTKKQKDT